MCRAERLVRWVAPVLALFLAAGCGRLLHKPPLRILAGSEIRDLEPLLPAMEKAAGAPIEFVYSGTLDAVETLEAGADFDAVWVSHGKYLLLTPAIRDRIRASERIMLSPVILGVKAAKAAELGWDKADPTWAAIVHTAAASRFSFGMTNPASSNTGFTALVGVAAALANKQEGLTLADIKTQELGQLFSGQKLVAGSSGWLAEAYVRDEARVDGIINYESVILQLNAAGHLKERLVPIYPKEGIVTADYPLMLLKDGRRKAYDSLVGYLRSPGAQAEITRLTLRRPAVPGVPAAPSIPTRTLIELPFPASRDLLDALIDAYQGRLRRPASTYFAIDTSGSMRGEGISQLRAAVLALAGGDQSLTSRYARFQTREQVFLMPFSSFPGEPLRFTLPERFDQAGAVLAQVRSLAEQLRAEGGTAIFDSVKVALETAQADRRKAPGRQYSVVIMTDGKNENGTTQEAFDTWYLSQPEASQGIPVFGLLFGQARRDQLEHIAELTGGRVFDTRKDLKTAFKEIRGYQ